MSYGRPWKRTTAASQTALKLPRRNKYRFFTFSISFSYF